MKFFEENFNFSLTHRQFKNYYYKLNSYVDNYPKQIVRHQSQLVERYQEVDFKNLVDLASLDMRLRYIIIKFCLDIEHSIKLNIMRSITYLENEDGYKVVQRFFGYVRQTSKIKNPYKK
ncbi:Abi family protein [Staphylococcus pseudintermedius]|nr:Abi family protein [Staphylococcus pseudintermedius]MDE9931194.1 Abi family protein [Staphylococcus pseudintermedius]MDE9936354.1 Abi family protein [Staphylococcus pseudintermedius]